VWILGVEFGSLLIKVINANFVNVIWSFDK
jgi:hypothetical protein